VDDPVTEVDVVLGIVLGVVMTNKDVDVDTVKIDLVSLYNI
jgi:hypothetical protein